MPLRFHRALAIGLLLFSSSLFLRSDRARAENVAWDEAGLAKAAQELSLESMKNLEGISPSKSETQTFIENLRKGRTDWATYFSDGVAAQMSWGVSLRGPKPYLLNSYTLMTPASVTKLFVAGALLQYRQSTDRIPTRITWDVVKGGTVQNLQVIGSGDPTWGEQDFGEKLTTRADEIANLLKSRGISEIKGPIIVRGSDARWNTIKRPYGWKSEFGLQCSAALAQAINLQSNCARFIVTGPGTGKWLDPGVPVNVTVNVTKSSRTGLSVRAVDTEWVDSYSYEITGKITSGTSRTFYLPVHRTTDWFKNLLEDALKRKQISRTGTVFSGSLIKQEAAVYSPELKTIFKPFLKDSVNFLGDALYKYLASTVLIGPKMTFGSMGDAGRILIKQYAHEIGSWADLSVIYDGSGLSYQNRVSADGIMQILEHMQKDEEFAAFWDWLPIAGVDGTLKDRMKGTEAYNFLRAKTGTLDKVSNLAGYVPDRDSSGQIVGYIPFVILSGTLGYTSASRTVQNKVGAALAALAKNQ